MRRKTFLISVCTLILVGVGCYNYNTYKLTPKKQVTKASLLSEAKLADPVMNWANGLKDSKGIHIAKMIESNDVVKYYLLTSNYRIDNMSVSNNYRHKEIDINISENINKEEATMIREDTIQGDKTKTITINGETVNVSSIIELK